MAAKPAQDPSITMPASHHCMYGCRYDKQSAQEPRPGTGGEPPRHDQLTGVGKDTRVNLLTLLRFVSAIRCKYHCQGAVYAVFTTEFAIRLHLGTI